MFPFGVLNTQATQLFGTFFWNLLLAKEPLSRQIEFGVISFGKQVHPHRERGEGR